MPRTPGGTTPDGQSIQYAYMFERESEPPVWSPTKQLDALLRAIANYIIRECGDKKDVYLTPGKLAAFYKDVGGNYDSIFVDTPHNSLSLMWTITGCQHTLLPSKNDFEPPSVPALTLRGFSRWESLEILLGPEEHVPFLQYAVKNWGLKHPDTGEPFPPDLPATVFPADADQEVDRWHTRCARQLNAEGTSGDEARRQHHGAQRRKSPQEEEGNEERTQRPPPRRRAAEGDYVPRHPPNAYVNGRQPDARGPKISSRPTRKYRHGSPSGERMRRKSFSDCPPSPSPNADASTPAFTADHLEPEPRRPRFTRQPYARDASDDSEEEAFAPRQRSKRKPRPDGAPPPGVRRFAPAVGPAIEVSDAPPSFRPHRADLRMEDHKQRVGSSGSPVDAIRSKFTDFAAKVVPGIVASDRPRGASRRGSHDDRVQPRRSRERVQPSRLSRSHSELESEEASELETSEDSARMRRRMRERERERERDRDRDRLRDRGRYRDDEQFEERGHLRRPEAQRRTSSHADVDRRRDYPLFGEVRDDREDRKRWDRERRDERNSSPIKGVSGRRYPPEPAYS